MMTFIEALDQEIKALWQSLETDPRFLKVKELERIRALYMKDESPILENPTNLLDPTGILQSRGRKASPARQAALKETIRFLEAKTEPVKTAEILKHLIEIGVELGGTDPQNNLSALLHHSDHFESHGRTGWTLKNSTNPKERSSQNALGGSMRSSDFSLRTDQLRRNNPLMPNMLQGTKE